MYLKTLVLKGFKSFADKVILTLEPGITAIVGPNGSGKSNISDAVLWVLGERNAKHLRGNSMEDVIFAGSSARKPTSFAEVTLVLDNTDHTLPVDFAHVSITRRMYKSGESEYLINDTVARRMDILDILHDSGLGTGTHSIISQGSLDSVLQSRPEDRRALIEEAAGVLKHKQRLEKSARKLERMANNVARVSDVVQEIGRQLRPLERKAKQAKAYSELAEELMAARLAIAVDDLRTLRCEHEDAQGIEAQRQAKLEEVSQRIESTERKLERIQEEIRASNEGAGELSARSRKAASVLEHIDSCILMARERVRQCEERSLELSVQLEKDDMELASLQGDFEKVKAEADRSEAAHAQMAERVDALDAKSGELNAKLSERHAQHAAYVREQATLENAIIELTEKQTHLRETLASDVARIKVTQDKIGEMSSQVARLSTDARQAEESASALEASLADMDAEEKAARTLVASCIQARKEADEALDQARKTVQSIDAQLQAFEEIERSIMRDAGEVRLWLEENRGSLGLDLSPLSHLIKVEEGYEGLVEYLLQGDAQGLLLDSYQDLERIMADLESAEVDGAATFFVTDGAEHGAQTTATSVKLPPGAFVLTDVLECDGRVSSVVDAVLGSLVVCPDLASAIAAHRADEKGLTYLTADADIIWPSGKVTLGRISEDVASNEFVRLKRIEELKTSLIDAKSTSESALAQTQQAESALARAQEDSLVVTEKLAHLRGSAQAARDEADQAARKLALQREELERTQERLVTYQESLDQSKPDAERIAQELTAGKVRLDELKGLLEESSLSTTPLSTDLEETTFQLNEAKLELAKLHEKNEYQKRVLLRHVQDMDRIEQRKDEARALQRAKSSISTAMLPIITALEVLSERASRLAQRLEIEAHDAVGRSEEKLTLINELREMAKASHGEYSRMAEELSNARIEKTKLEMQVEAAVKVIIDDCGASLERALELPVLEDRPEVEETVFRLNRRISNMGTINPDASREYDELKERYDFMFGQLEDLNTATRSLRRINAIIESRMKEDFARTFETVNANFQEIFSTLFPNGNGYLSLEDPDDMDNSGIEVNAQPAGKRIRKMSLMSGGEKSLTALALLFALYKTRATPFYILDEVEAALDDTNLRRLTAYIDAMRDTTQMIMITHQRRTMESADVLFGVSMQSDGVTKVVSQKLDQALRNAE